MQFRKRRILVVNKALQYGSVVFAALLILGALGFHSLLTYYRLKGHLPADFGTTRFALNLLVDVLITMGVSVVALGGVIVLQSHRVAGPIYRCELTMKRLQKGDLTDFIKLRKGDLLVPFSEEINLAVANLREIAQEDRANVQDVIRQLELAKNAIQTPEVLKSLDRAIETLGKVGRRLRFDPESARHHMAGVESGEMSSSAIPAPQVRAGTPMYNVGKVMVLKPPERSGLTAQGEVRAPGAALAASLPGSAPLPPPAPAPHPALAGPAANASSASPPPPGSKPLTRPSDGEQTVLAPPPAPPPVFVGGPRPGPGFHYGSPATGAPGFHYGAPPPGMPGSAQPGTPAMPGLPGGPGFQYGGPPAGRPSPGGPGFSYGAPPPAGGSPFAATVANRPAFADAAPPPPGAPPRARSPEPPSPGGPLPPATPA